MLKNGNKGMIKLISIWGYTVFSELGEQGKVEGKSSPGGHWGGGRVLKARGLITWILQYCIDHKWTLFPLRVNQLIKKKPHDQLWHVFGSHLQLHAAITGNVEAEELGLGVGSKLLQSLKQQVVTLASNKGVLKTVQSAAQGALRSGWVLLLPTPEERARALTELLIESELTVFGTELGK